MLRSSRAAAAERRWPKVANGSVPPSTSSTRTSAGSNDAELAPQAACRELADLPGDLDAGGPGADDHDREPLLLLGEARRDLGHLERAEDPALQLERVVDRLHPGREDRELVVAEVRLTGARGHDQAVVGHVERHVGNPARVHHPPVEVEAGDLGELDRDVPRVAEHVPQRRRDLAGWQDAGRHLVEQRLEEVVVAPVEQGHLDPADAPEEAARGQPAEATAHHHDPMAQLPLSALRRRSADRPGRPFAHVRRLSCVGRFRGDEAVGGVDEREVRERLREVAEVLPGGDVDLLCVEEQRAGEREQLLEQRPGAFRSRRRSRAPRPARTSRS